MIGMHPFCIDFKALDLLGMEVQVMQMLGMEVQGMQMLGMEVQAMEMVMWSSAAPSHSLSVHV